MGCLTCGADDVSPEHFLRPCPDSVEARLAQAWRAYRARGDVSRQAYRHFAAGFLAGVASR